MTCNHAASVLGTVQKQLYPHSCSVGLAMWLLQSNSTDTLKKLLHITSTVTVQQDTVLQGIAIFVCICLQYFSQHTVFWAHKYVWQLYRSLQLYGSLLPVFCFYFSVWFWFFSYCVYFYLLLLLFFNHLIFKVYWLALCNINILGSAVENHRQPCP